MVERQKKVHDSLIYQRGVVARELFSPGQEVRVNHTGYNQPDRFVAALDYFTQAGCTQEFIHYILDEAGKWHDFCDPIDFYGMTPSKLDKVLGDRLNPTYRLANGSLDHIYEHGFNRHDRVHIDKVTRQARKLVRRADFDSHEDKVAAERRTVAAARGHDMGNILSRKIHSMVSPRIFAAVFQEAAEDADQWRIIRRAIQLHDEPIASQLIDSFRTVTKEDGTVHELTGEALLTKIRERFGVEALALIIADKTDIGRHRISQKAQNIEAVNADPHLEVNLLGETNNLVLSEDKSQLDWNLAFTPGMDAASNYAHLSRSRTTGELRRALVSETTQARHIDSTLPTPHFQTWQQLFWKLYFERIYLVVQSAFALYPELTKFNIVMVDTDDGHDLDSGEVVTNRFTRQGYAKTFEIVKKKYVDPMGSKHT